MNKQIFYELVGEQTKIYEFIETREKKIFQGPLGYDWMEKESEVLWNFQS